MIKLFMRIFLITLGLILGVILAIHMFASLVLGPRPFLEQEAHYYLAALLEGQLKNASPQEVENLALEVLKSKGINYAIYPSGGAQVPADMGNHFYPQSELVSLPNTFDTVFYLPFDEGRSVLAVGPLYTKGGPPADVLPFVFSMVVILAGLAALLISRPAWQNISRFEEATLRLSEGDMTARAHDIRGPVRDLAQRFNRMADALQHTFESQKHLLQAVSHELRTPVARIHFELEMLELADDPQKRHERAQNMVDHLTELNDMLDELLLFVRLDADGPTDKQAPFLLKSALNKLESDFAATAAGKLTITSAVSEDFSLTAQQRMFSRAVGNLLQNALRYAHSQVTLACEVDGDYLVVSVTDDGPGIPVEHREKIFEPFSRIDESRNKISGGVGLGLAIVQRIVTRHNGEIFIQSPPTGGVCFVTHWPLN